MGKYKDLYIKFNNLEEENKELINKYKEEYIYEDNSKIPLNIYILKSKKNIGLISSDTTVHIWAWSDFKDETKGKILAYKNSGNVILNKLMEFDSFPSEELLNKYSLRIDKFINNI
ncbi:hypothetical protein [Clostridium sp.]|uniref:hypothetical protein n=1 Tax=Clostridium sp. TaxID=1506 RepID=UPI002617AFE5|nr:hypothetical protein [Clostridium sp.]